MAAKPSSKKPKRTSGRKSSTGSKPQAKKARKRAGKKAAGPKDKCFVISPFGGWHDDYYGEIFCPSIKAAGMEPCRADDLFRSSAIVHDIWHLVVSSRVLLADLTDKNPNVFYELGLAHAARKPVLLLTQSMDDVPFDLRALRVITYDVEHPDWGQVLRENIKQGLKETLESPERSVLPTFLLEEPTDQPHVSADEARLIGLQQQVDSLRTELRATHAGFGRKPRIPANEARELIIRFAEEGLPRGMIVRRVTDRGAPRSWVEREVDRRFGPRKDID
jgi:hypothetical protein